jgi:hypothetical protein
MKKYLLVIFTIIGSSQFSFGNISLNETHRFYDDHYASYTGDSDQIYWDYTILDQKGEKILLQTYLVNNRVFSKWVNRADWDGSIEFGAGNINISCQKIGGVIENLKAKHYDIKTCKVSKQYKEQDINGINELVDETLWYGPVLGRVVKKVKRTQFEDQRAKDSLSWTLVAIGIRH